MLLYSLGSVQLDCVALRKSAIENQQPVLYEIFDTSLSFVSHGHALEKKEKGSLLTSLFNLNQVIVYPQQD